MAKYLLSIDAGHGGCKCVLFDVESRKYFTSFEKWGYITPGDDFLLKEFDPNLFFEKICKGVKKLLKKVKANPKDILAISSSSMRHSFVFLDSNGREIYAGPNTDARGALYQDIIEEKIGDRIYSITGQWPPLIFVPARLLWFREEEPEKFERIRYVLATNDWIIYRLCKTFATEPSIASATLLLDIKKMTWNQELLDLLELSHITLPDIHRTGEVVGELSEDAAKKMNLDKGIPVVMGGADSQIAMLACSALNNGDTAVIAGTSAPVMMSMSKPVVDEKMRTWTSCHVVKDRWVLEANAQITGLNYEWLKSILKEIVGGDDKTIYKIMEDMASSVKAAPNDVYAFLGPEIMDVSNISIVRPGMFLFQQPSHPMNPKPPSFKHLVRSALENISFAIRANVELLEEITKNSVDNIYVTGGLTRSNVWLRTLAEITGRKILVSKVEEGTAFGCAIGAAVGIGLYKNIEEALKNMVELREEILPVDKELYESGYERWKELYYKIADL